MNAVFAVIAAFMSMFQLGSQITYTTDIGTSCPNMVLPYTVPTQVPDVDGYARSASYYGLWFDGVDDAAILPGFDAAAGGNALTFCMWVYARRNNWGFIFDGFTADNKGRLTCYLSSGRVRWTWGAGKIIQSISTSFPTDQWVHLAVTYSCASKNGGVYKMYWNGVETPCEWLTYRPSWLEINDVATFYVGSRGAGDIVLDGKIVDLRFIPATLSQAQVQSVMAGGDYAGATGHYLWQTETGQVVYDLSGNGHDGYLGTTLAAEPTDPTWARYRRLTPQGPQE